VTAVILGLSRAIGETLAVSMVIGNVEGLPNPLFSLRSLFTPTINITAEIVQNFQESSGIARDAYWLLAFTLLIVSFLFICVSRYFASRSVYK
jgi:phosphate transport system permease protein